MSDSLEFRPRCEMQLAGGDPAQVLERMNRRIVDCAVLLMPLDTDRYHVQQISRSPMVVCLRSDDSLASEPALELGEIASRIKVFPDPQAQPAAHSRRIDLFKELALPHAGDLFRKHTGRHAMDGESGLRSRAHRSAFALDAGLITRPLVGIDWTVDTAFVLRAPMDHIALPFLERFHPQQWRLVRKKANPERVHAEQLKLLA